MPASHQTLARRPSRTRLPALATLLAALAAIVGLLALTPTPASAHKIYFPGPSFGSEGSGNGQFKEPVGVAVNDSTELGDEQAGDVYVADTGNKRVEVFSAAGVFQGQFNGSGEYEVTVAGKLEKKTGAAAPGGAFTAPEQVAVDNSTEVGDPSKGDVYVTDPGRKAIDKFTAKGEYVEQLTKTEGCEKDEHPGEASAVPSRDRQSGHDPVRRTAQPGRGSFRRSVGVRSRKAGTRTQQATSTSSAPLAPLLRGFGLDC